MVRINVSAGWIAAAAVLLLRSPAMAATKAKPAPLPKGVFKDCRDCPQMVTIPAGAFMMGSPVSEKNRGAEDLHKVTFAKPFAVSRFEVTFDEWRACMKGGGCAPMLPPDEGWGRGKRPVIYMNWDDAHAYVGWLAKSTGKPYRMLSESEWEYAARAGSKTAFSYGPFLSAAQANFDASSKTDLNPKGVKRAKTTPVGSFKPNGFGLYDMHGNVFEWVQDCWHDDYTDAPADGSAWEGKECEGRMLRGGSWEDYAGDIRAAARTGGGADERSYADGIRVALDLPVKP